MVEQLANFGETTLAEALDDSETGIDVTDDVFPASGNFRLIVDDEIMLATANSYPTVTVTRGAESTTAASHSNGADIKMVVTAASLPLIVTENQTTIADDPDWSAKGQLAVGTGTDTASLLTVGTNDFVLTAASGEATGLKWARPPGYEWAYAAHTSGNVSITATTEGTANTIISAGAVTYDGAPVWLQANFTMWRPDTTAASRAIYLVLYDGSSSIGTLAEYQLASSADDRIPVSISYRFTPAASSKTYSLRAYASAATALVAAGAGGNGNRMPASIRITKV